MGGLANKEKWTAHEVKQRLEAGEELSTLGQTNDCGGWRLAATIDYLIKRDGLPILSYTRKGFGRCAFYRLVRCMYQPAQDDIFSGGGGNPHTERTTKGQGNVSRNK